jgi:hypothetical protein
MGMKRSIQNTIQLINDYKNHMRDFALSSKRNICDDEQNKNEVRFKKVILLTENINLKFVKSILSVKSKNYFNMQSSLQ